MSLQLPLEDIFHKIGVYLGSFLDYDRSYVEYGKMDFVRIFVHLDTREGLVASSNIHYRGYVHHHRCDYEGVLFLCKRCCEGGHIFKGYPLALSGNKG